MMTYGKVGRSKRNRHVRQDWEDKKADRLTDRQTDRQTDLMRFEPLTTHRTTQHRLPGLL